MTVLQLTDTPKEIVMKMCDGNPGAIHVMMAFERVAREIDPDSSDPFTLGMHRLDELDIRGSQIYVLAKYSCGGKVRNLGLILRGLQLGFIDGDRVKKAAEDPSGLDALNIGEMKKLDEQVTARLPNFQEDKETEET